MAEPFRKVPASSVPASGNAASSAAGTCGTDAGAADASVTSRRPASVSRNTADPPTSRTNAPGADPIVNRRRLA